jgi:uncharacterized protein YecE (DUF72 family)
MPRFTRIGCQSWGYEDWVTPLAGETVFYPPGTKKEEMLSLYARIFDTIEVDSTLYGTPSPATLQKWHDSTPNDFKFSLKFPREITHDLELRPPSLGLMHEFVAACEMLGEKLGIFLVQFPERFEPTSENRSRLGSFLAALPREHRFVVEFRAEGWFTQETVDTLDQNGIGLCLVEGRWIRREIMLQFLNRPALPFRYIRVMGERDLLRFDRVQRPRDEIIALWGSAIERMAADEVFVYADNYFEGFAPATVNKFQESLGQPIRSPKTLVEQPTLF